MNNYLININIGNNTHYIDQCDIFNKNRNHHLCINFGGNDKNTEKSLRENCDYFFSYKETWLRNLYHVFTKNNFWKKYKYT